MSDLNAKDLRVVLDIVHGLHDAADGIEMPIPVLARLGRLLGCESVTYARVLHASGGLLAATVDPADMDQSGIPEFRAVLNQHPGFAAYRCGQLRLGTSAALTDLADRRTLQRLPLYVDFYQPTGTNDQLLCVVNSDNQQISVLAFDRTRPGFSDRDRAIVDLVTPHVAQSVQHRRRLTALAATVSILGRHSREIEQARPRLSALTSREREIVEHLMGGATNREIARSLGISPRTVHKHLEHIYHKLNLTNRTSLITMIHQANEVTVDAG